MLVEGGPTVAAAFLRGGFVDEIVAYLAPVLLGAGPTSVADLGIASISEALRPALVDVAVIDPVEPDDQPNVRLTLRPR